MLLYCDQLHKKWWEQIYSVYKENSPHNSKHLFDIYSFTHIFWPLLLVALYKSMINIHTNVFAILIFVATVYFEIYENQDKHILKYHRIEVNSQGRSSYRGDSLINIMGDILCNLIGIMIALYVTRNTSIVIILGLIVLIINKVGIKIWTDFYKFATKK